MSRDSKFANVALQSHFVRLVHKAVQHTLIYLFFFAWCDIRGSKKKKKKKKKKKFPAKARSFLEIKKNFEIYERTNAIHG